MLPARNEATPIIDVIQGRAQAMAPEIRVYEVPDVSQLLRSTDSEIRHLLRTGQLRGFKIGQKWRVPHNAVIDFINGGGCL